ncbi:MAG: hypothetical protein V3U26_04655 [Dehalococcoidia bacterium]
MTSNPHYIGLTEFVEDFARTLSRAPVKPRYRDREELRRWLVPVVKAYLADKLGQQEIPYHLWQRRSRGGRAIDSIPIFVAPFVPDLAVEVTQTPILAVLSTLIKDNRTLATKIGAAIGQAIILSHQYPAVISFVLHSVRREEYRLYLEREIQLDLWSRHKIKLVLRDQFISSDPPKGS